MYNFKAKCEMFYNSFKFFWESLGFKKTRVGFHQVYELQVYDYLTMVKVTELEIKIQGPVVQNLVSLTLG